MMHYSIKTLADMLFDHCVPFEVTTDADGNENNQIWYPSKENKVCDVICHKYSYGYEQGLLEIMGLLTEKESEIDSVAGWLTPEDVFERIWRHWVKNHTRVLITMKDEENDY